MNKNNISFIVIGGIPENRVLGLGNAMEKWGMLNKIFFIFANFLAW